jgi:hypothetical protein
LSVLSGAVITGFAVAQPADFETVDLKDGYVRIEAKTYSLEIPKGWAVGRETPWGSRKIGSGSGGEMGAMTAPPSEQTWDQLYRTALYYIGRETKDKPTPYTIVKTKRGYEAASFSMVDRDGFATERYMMVKHPSKGLLALSVKIKEKKNEKELAGHFKRMVDSADFK